MKKVRDGYKMTDLGEIPEEWEVKKLGDIFNLRNERFNPLENKNVRYIALEHIEQCTGRIIEIGNSDKTTSMKTNFKRGDVLFGKLRPYLRKFWFAEFDGVCATEILPLIIKQNNIPKFGFYIIQQDRFIEYTNQSSFGTKMPRISWNDIKEFSIPVPSILEQQKISLILSSVDEQIENTDKLIEKIKELKKGLMRRLLTKGIRHDRFKDTEIGRIPEEWDINKLSNVGEIITGNTPKTAENENYGLEYMWVSPADMGESKYIIKTNKMLSKLGLEKTRKLPKGSILVTCIGSTIGKIGIAGYQLSTNQQINSIVCVPCFDNEFIYYAIDFNFNNYMSYISTQAIPIINKTTFSDFQIQIPTLAEQKHISSILSSVDEQIGKHEAKKEKLQELKKGLMQKLLTGSIRVIMN